MWQKRINVGAIACTSLLVLCVIFPLIQQSREAARKTHSKNNLKQIGLALHNYADTYQGLPAGGVFDGTRHGFHGWMTVILPYMDDSPFYSYVKLDEPWDSKSNAGLFLNAMSCYENPSESSEHGHWEFPVAHYSGNPRVMAVNSYVNLDEIDKQVFLAGELDGRFVPWGCPYNWRELNNLNSSPPTYGRSTLDGCQFLFADGRVEFIANDVSKDVLQRMSGRDLTGFNANLLTFQIPSTFPCPTDALWHTWNGRDEVKRDIHGNVKFCQTRSGK